MQRVDLLPMPEGTPEEVPVTCNGRVAVMLLRSQRMRYNGVEISASKFEALCGKGDAKKWKNSVHHADAEGSPLMVWLRATTKYCFAALGHTGQ